MASQKKVIVRRFLGDSLPGYLPPSGFVADGAVTFLDLSGRLTSVPLAELKYVAYVRDFNLSDLGSLERLLRRSFLARPRTEGLWVRVTFRTNDTLEGLVSTGLCLLDEVLDLQGVQLTPPDTRTNTQRVYIPRAAMSHLELLGIVSASSRKTVAAKARGAVEQERLFSEPEQGS